MDAKKNSAKNTKPGEIVTTVSGKDMNIVCQNIDDAAFAIWVRGLLQNWRQGTVGCKGRADVSHSGKKPWKQKGTGRARAGTARSPLWRGGGVTFGPQPRVRTLTVSKKMRAAVLNDLLWRAAEQGNVLCLDWQLESDIPKTALAYGALNKAALTQEKVMVLLPAHDDIHYAAFVNIPTIRIAFFDQVNAYDLAVADKLVVLKKDFDVFKQVVSSWI